LAAPLLKIWLISVIGFSSTAPTASAVLPAKARHAG
jgi:hypothetical protein